MQVELTLNRVSTLPDLAAFQRGSSVIPGCHCDGSPVRALALTRRGPAGADREPGDGARRALRGRRQRARGGARTGELRLGPS